MGRKRKEEGWEGQREHRNKNKIKNPTLIKQQQQQKTQ
jgi:hypothetical protein